MEEVNVFIFKTSDEEALALKNVLMSNSYNVVGIACNLEDALTQYFNLSIDIMIIDLFIKDSLDGIAFVEHILFSHHTIEPFIFLTNSNNASLYKKVKYTRPLAILNHPFNELEILYTLEGAAKKSFKYIKKHISPKDNIHIDERSIFLKKKNAFYRINLKNIIYIEVENRYCNIITDKGKFIVMMPLSKIKEYLNASLFIQTHRKYIVNSETIEQIVLRDNLLILKGNHKVNMSTSYKKILQNFKILK